MQVSHWSTSAALCICRAAQGAWHALVCYFVPMYAMVTPDVNGVADDFNEIGTAIYFATIIVVNLKLCMRTRWVFGADKHA